MPPGELNAVRIDVYLYLYTAPCGDERVPDTAL
jgi:hypothetical protein